jgi:hypothetical protein
MLTAGNGLTMLPKHLKRLRVDKEFQVGYKKPPKSTQFQPGQSGNPSGRPKRKASTFAESIERELNTVITVVESGKQLRITKRQAIVKQQTNKALTGDSKAATLVMKAVEPLQFDPTDSLSPVLHAMRAIHAKHEASSQNVARTTSAASVPVEVNDEHD